MCPLPTAFILEPLWDPCHIRHTSDLGEKSFGNKTEARFHCQGPCRRTLHFTPFFQGRLGFHGLSCLCSPRGSGACWDSGGQCEAGCSGHRGRRLMRLWKMEVPMALE